MTMDEKKILEALASLMKSNKKEDRDALAEIIVEYVQPNHLSEEFTRGLLNTRRLNPGDSLVKKVRKGIKVRTLVPGAVHLATEITVSERMNYILDGADVKVTANLWELENGEIGTVADIRREMAAKLRDFYFTKLFTALSTVWSATNTPDNYTSVGGVITNTALEDAINWVNQNAGGVKAVIGMRAVMTPITKFAAFWDDGGSNVAASQNAIDEIRQTGRLGRYYGAPLQSVDPIYNNPEDYEDLFAPVADKILVIGQSVGEFILYGEVKTKQWEDMDPTPPYWFLELYQQFGMIIDNALGIYVLDGVTAS